MSVRKAFSKDELILSLVSLDFATWSGALTQQWLVCAVVSGVAAIVAISLYKLFTGRSAVLLNALRMYY